MGAIPQSETTKKLPFNTDLFGFEGPITVPLIPPVPILSNNARPTTVLSIISLNSLIFIVARDYFIDFLKDFELGEYKVWPIKIHHNNEILENYRLFHLSYPSDDKLIDYENSMFSVGEIGDWRDTSKRKKVTVKNYSDYINLREVLNDTGNQIKHEKIVLDFHKAKEDLIRLETQRVRGYYFSERLKSEIEKQRFTAISFVEVGWRKKNVEVKNTNDDIA